MTDECCEICKFYMDNECHRFPPQIYVDQDGASSTFPLVRRQEWCGEFKLQIIDSFQKQKKSDEKDA